MGESNYADGYGDGPNRRPRVCLGNAFKANSNVDIYLNATTKSAINGNVCDSTGVAWSILEAGAADYNNAQGNTGNGLFTKVGTNSQFANNLTY